jgi:hypothetical protein
VAEYTWCRNCSAKPNLALTDHVAENTWCRNCSAKPN